MSKKVKLISNIASPDITERKRTKNIFWKPLGSIILDIGR